MRRQGRHDKYSKQRGGYVPRRPDVDMNIALWRKYETIMRYHYTLTRNAKIVRTDYIKCR